MKGFTSLTNTIRVAETDQEMNDVLCIIKEKSKEMLLKGLKVWKPELINTDEINKMYSKPVYYYGMINNDIYGAFILVEKDELFWKDNLEDKAFYLHTTQS